MPTVHGIVADTFTIVGAEVKTLKRLVRNGTSLDRHDTARLGALVKTMREAQAAQLEALDREGIDRMDEAELIKQLRAELGD